ncbi:unnamed protein product [Cunninghamella echinulata]
MTKDGRPSLVKTTAVQVALRIRPITDKDRTQPRFANLNDDNCLKVMDNSLRVIPHNKIFNFDHIFGPSSQQQEIFATIGENLIHKFIEGYNVTILAYGQTSSGKTYTMGTMQHNGRFDATEEGIVPRAMSLMFDVLQQQQQQQSHEKSSLFSSPPIPVPSTSTSSSIQQRPVSPTSSVSSATTALSKGSRLRPRSRISKVPAPPPTPSRSTHYSQQTSSSSSSPQNKYTVKVSFVEIYNEELIDLLNDAPIEERPPIVIREDPKGQIYWTGVKEVVVKNAEDVLHYLEQGTQSRATGATDMNEKSSRSHAIFSVTLQQEKPISSSSAPVTRSESPSPMNMKRSSLKNLKQDDTEYIITSSKFHFVDLAGSERLKRTAAKGDRRKEGININAGLLALGNVISALGDTSKRGSHVPYRDSKLTRLLQDSLGGNATTLMIACVSPIEFNLSETLNTLHYANRARNIKNRSEKNEVEEWMTTENMELLRSIIAKLKNEVNILKSATSTTSMSPTTRNGLISISPNGFDDDEDDVDDNDNYDTEQLLQQQRLHIADLQHQIEELDGQATVTHERNKVVEAELQRLRKLDMLRQKKKEEDVNFEHLVEPVIEEYEKSIAKLESELSVARAALHHSDFGIEDLQTKCDALQRIVEQQQETMSDLQSRVSKLSEREQSNAAYIEELELKLEQSAMESKRDQDQLNDVRSKLLKWKEKEDNTENYIHDLERRLAISEENQLKLTQAVETLEQQRTEQSIMITKLKKQSNRNSDFSSSQQQLMLNEIDELTTKCKEIEMEKEDWKQKAQQQQLNNEPLENKNHSRESSFNNNDHDLHNNALLQNGNDDDITGKNQKRKSGHRRSLADEQQAAFLLSKAAELRAEEHQARAEKLEQQLKKLELEHKETINELNDMFQRYQETLNHVEHLENTSMLSSTQTPFPTSHSQPSISSSTTVSDDDNNTATTAATTNTTTKEFMPPLPSTFSVVDNHHHAHTAHTNGLHLGQEMLRGQDQEHRNTIAKLEKQIDTLNDHVTRHRDSLEAITLEKTQQADTFSDYIAELKNTIQRLETESEEANNKIRSLQHAADDHDDLVERTVFQLDELMEKNEDLLKQYATTKSALETLQQKHRSIIEEKSNLTHQLDQLQHQHEQTLQLHQDELEMAKNQVKEHSDLSLQQVNELEIECQSLRSKLEEQNQKEIALLHQVTQSQETLQKAEKTYQDKINQLVQSMDEERLNWKEQLESKLKEKELAHQEQLEKEKADVIQQVESKWLVHETEWKQQMQQLETLLQEKDDHHQRQLKELKSTHLQIVATERTEATNQLEAAWLERETEWQHQIKQLEALMQEKENQHQHQLKEMSDAHLNGLDSEKAEALHQLETTWLARQSEWQHQLTQLQQEGLEKEKKYKMDMEAMKRDHHTQLEKEKERVIKETEDTVSLKHTSEWEEKANDIEKKWEEKTNILNKTWQEQMDGLEKKIQGHHQSQIQELLNSHEQEKKQRQIEKEQHVLDLAETHEKEKKDSLHQVESVWLARQSEWEQKMQTTQHDLDQLKNQLEEKEKAYDLEHISLMDMKLLLDKAQKEIEDAQSDITEYESLLEEADKNIAELTTKLEQAMENEQMLERVMDDAVKENEATAMKLKSLEEQYALLLSKQQEIEQGHEKKIKDVKRLEQLLEEKSQQCKKHEEEIAKLKADHYTVTLTSDQLLTTKNELEQDHIEKLKAMTLLEQQLEEKKEQCHQQQKEIALLKTDLSTLKLNIDQHASTSADKEVMLQQIKAQVANAEQLSLEKQKEYDVLNKNYKKATESLMELETKLASMAEQQKLDKEHYEKELDQLTLSHHQQVETERSTLHKDITHAQAQVGNTKALYEQLLKEHDELKSEYQQQLLSLQQEHEQQLLLSKKEMEKDDEEFILPEPPIIPHHSSSSSSPTVQNNDDDKEKQRLLDENEEYAELTKTLEQELDKVTQELNKLVIETNENEVTIQEQLQKIQQLEKEKEKHQSSTDMNNTSRALKNDNDILKQKVAELEQRCHQQEKEYLTQVQERDQQSAEQIDQMTHQQQQMQLAWDKDKQEKDKLTRQVKLLEEKMDLLLQDKKKFLCF